MNLSFWRDKAIFVLLLVMFFSSGCANIDSYITSYIVLFKDWLYCKDVSESRFFPISPDFIIFPEPIDETSLLRTDGVYWMSKMEAGNSAPQCEYIRFWPDGRVCRRYIDDTVPTAEIADSFKKAEMGFFLCDGTNIWVELYKPDRYTMSEGTVTGRDLTFNNSREEHSFEFSFYYDPRKYTFLPLQGMNRMPDWSPTGMLQNATSPMSSLW